MYKLQMNGQGWLLETVLPLVIHMYVSESRLLVSPRKIFMSQIEVGENITTLHLGVLGRNMDKWNCLWRSKVLEGESFMEVVEASMKEEILFHTFAWTDWKYQYFQEAREYITSLNK